VRSNLPTIQRCHPFIETERANVEALTAKVGVEAAFDKMRAAQEVKHLKDQVEKQNNEIKTVVWKMNEMMLANKNSEDKSSSREEHILYLEDTVSNLHSSLAVLADERKEIEERTDQAAREMKKQIESLCGGSSEPRVPFSSRLVIPFNVPALKPELSGPSVGKIGLGEVEQWMSAETGVGTAEAGTQTDEDLTFGMLTSMGNHGISTGLSGMPGEPQNILERALFMGDDSSSGFDFSVDHNAGEVAERPRDNRHLNGVQATRPEVYSSLAGEGDIQDSALSQVALSVGVINPSDNCPATIDTASRTPTTHKEPDFPQGAQTCSKPPATIGDVQVSVPASSAASMKANDSTSGTSSDSVGTPSQAMPPTQIAPAANSDDGRRTTAFLASRGNVPVPVTVQGSQAQSARSAASIPVASQTSQPSSATPVVRKWQKPSPSSLQQSSKNAGNEDSTPEWMQKFKKIGARNQAEHVIETSGATPAGNATRTSFESLRHKTQAIAPAPAPLAKWTPRKKKTEDDSDSDDSFARSFMRGAQMGQVKKKDESSSDDESVDETDDGNKSLSSPPSILRSKVNASPTKSPGKHVDFSAKVGENDSVVGIADYVDNSSWPDLETPNPHESDSESSGGDLHVAPPAVTPPPTSETEKTTTRKDDDSDSSASDSSGDDRKKKPVLGKPLAQASSTRSETSVSATPKQTQAAPTRKPARDDDESSSSDDDTRKKPVKSPGSVAVPAPVSSTRKAVPNADSDSESSEEEPPKQSIAAPAPAPVAASLESKNANKSLSDDEESDDEAPATLVKPNTGVEASMKQPVKSSTITTAPTASSSANKSGRPASSDDEDSSSSDGETRKTTAKPVSIPAQLPAKSSPAKDSDDESSDDESPKVATPALSTLQKPTPSAGRTIKKADSDDEDSSSSDDERRNVSRKPSTAVANAPKRRDESDDDSSEDEKTKVSIAPPTIPPPSKAPSTAVANAPKRRDESDDDSSEDEKSKPPLKVSVAPRPIPPPSKAASRANADSDDSSSSDEETGRQPVKPPTSAPPAPRKVVRSDNSDDDSSSEEEKPKPPRKSADSSNGASKSVDEPRPLPQQSAPKAVPSTAASKKVDNGNSSSDDSDDSGNKKSRRVQKTGLAGKSNAMLSGGKPADHSPVRKTPDFAKSITPGVTQGSTNNTPAASLETETPRKAKFVVRDGKLVKDDSVSNLSPVVSPKQPNSPRRTTMIPSTPGSARGKSPVPQASSIEKPLVPELSSEPASKATGTGSFQIVNGKLVKCVDGKDDKSSTKKKKKKSESGSKEKSSKSAKGSTKSSDDKKKKRPSF
jgi:hypothetical protein